MALFAPSSERPGAMHELGPMPMRKMSVLALARPNGPPVATAPEEVESDACP